MTLQLARSESDAPTELDRLVGQALEHTSAAIEELRELAHGIHPALLTTRGLAAAVEALADRAPVPVRIEIPDERYPASVESAAYFVAAEALTNVAKYARASAVRVAVTHGGDSLVIEVEDDGVGGAMLSTGSGLAGLRDRLAAFQGKLTIDSSGEGLASAPRFPCPRLRSSAQRSPRHPRASPARVGRSGRSRRASMRI